MAAEPLLQLADQTRPRKMNNLRPRATSFFATTRWLSFQTETQCGDVAAVFRRLVPAQALAALARQEEKPRL